MKTQNKNTLDFTKKIIVELTTLESIAIYGGATTYICSACIPTLDTK
ncbi:hypothetical protein N7U66_12665 [Lacinutrix neustonica]|uniref:Uncharacterized protein n=1 Tax=Lacinutrix neustonica TaxID=2980107 RepID=A0A9E8MTA6_9FLAO|nr:hypothetical protein [Lacinutrix neustonica]WAC01028.1 hypothetical protein N7U66_12665 [Lacinutrix neustonica]